MSIRNKDQQGQCFFPTRLRRVCRYQPCLRCIRQNATCGSSCPNPAAGMAIVSGEKTPQNGMFLFCFIGATRDGFTNRTFHPKMKTCIDPHNPISFSCAGTHLKTLVDSTPWHRRKLWNVSYGKRCEWNMSSCSELCWFFVFFLAPTEATHTNVFPSSLTLKKE